MGETRRIWGWQLIGKSFARKGRGGYGEPVESREQLGPALKRALASGKPARLNVKAKGFISPIVLATTNKRDKASIE